jgi:hypothetical protein
LRLAFTLLIPIRRFARILPFSAGVYGVEPGPGDGHLVRTIGALFKFIARNVIGPFFDIDGFFRENRRRKNNGRNTNGHNTNEYSQHNVAPFKTGKTPVAYAFPLLIWAKFLGDF